MNEDFLTPSEQLIAFLDGELDANQTTAFFAELSHNSELQEEMKDMVSIRNAFRNAQLTPPDAIRHSILINTGLQKATFMNQIRAGAGILAALWTLFTSKTAIAVYLLALGTGIWFATQNDDGKLKNSNFTSTESIDANIGNKKLTNNSNNIAIVASSEVTENTVKTKVSYSNFKVTKINKSEKNNSNENLVANNDNELTADNQNKTEMLLSSNLVLKNQDFPNLTSKQNFWSIPGLNLYINPDFLNDISLHIRTFNGVSYPEQTLTNLNNPLLNNFSIGLMYNFTGNLSIGLEAGFENFAMQFEGYEGDILYRYMQNYNSAWGGLAVQYTFSPILWLDYTQPYVKTLFGANELGPVLKLSAGGKYYITPNFAFIGGVEYGSFIYQINGNTFSTNKLGYTFGAMFGF